MSPVKWENKPLRNAVRIQWNGLCRLVCVLARIKFPVTSKETAKGHRSSLGQGSASWVGKHPSEELPSLTLSPGM
jgi:hypothetical protein